MLTFCSFIGMSKDPPMKTLAAMMLGFALAAVGMDTVTGQLRMTFGYPELLKGFDFLIAVIGLFGIGEILLTMEEGLAFKGKSRQDQFPHRLADLEGAAAVLAHLHPFVLIGCWMGITPGGATPASFMGYGMARRAAKDKEPSARATSRAWWRRKPRPTRPAPAPCCRC
jgi:putative tricarboxylic transport membrane protein